MPCKICWQADSSHIKLHKNVNGEGSIRKWCVSLPLLICNCNMYQSSSLINIDLSGITHPLLLIHLKVGIDFLLLCQWERTPLSVSFRLPWCQWISCISNSLHSFWPSPCYRLSQALSAFPSPSSPRQTLSRSLFDLVWVPQVELRVRFSFVFFISRQSDIERRRFGLL